MTPKELQIWLEEHGDTITQFMDYEVFVEAPDEMIERLGFWLDDPNWFDGSNTFVSLGADGTGSIFAVWVRTDITETPVVFLGSEGSRGVLARSPEEFAKILAYGPGVDEDYDGDDTAFDIDANWMLTDEDDPKELARSQKCHGYFKKKCEEKFGTLPSFDSLTAELKPKSIELGKFIDTVVNR